MQIHGRIYVVPRPPVLCINIWRRLWESTQKTMSVSLLIFHLYHESAETQEPNTCTVTAKSMSSALAPGRGGINGNTVTFLLSLSYH
ncbi:hypothetical protein C1H46_031230 [Malus baccata]|uniref:Uncharacterized protein n=1 Tax=Malus baccata TaxID=106549 RepID=A0A540L9R4_MALBA|nr:hypothetical protein C1H46_031230 [Malus baccata]